MDTQTHTDTQTTHTDTTHLHGYNHLPTHLPTIPSCPPTYLPTYIPTYLHADHAMISDDQDGQDDDARICLPACHPALPPDRRRHPTYIPTPICPPLYRPPAHRRGHRQGGRCPPMPAYPIPHTPLYTPPEGPLMRAPGAYGVAYQGTSSVGSRSNCPRPMPRLMSKMRACCSQMYPHRPSGRRAS